MSRLAARFAIVAVALLALPAAAAIPGADNPKAYTQHEHIKRRLDFNRRTLVEAYNSVGKRDPKWDGPAVKFLDAMALYFSYSGVEAFYYGKTEIPTREQFLALGKAALDAGCDDPIVTYCRGVVLHDAGQAAETAPLIDQAVTGLQAQKYPPYRVYAAAERVRRTLGGAAGEWGPDNPFAKVAWDNALAAIAGKLDARDLRFLMEGVEPFFEEMTLSRKLEFCKAVQASKDADPWVLNYLSGRYEVTAAWDARGAGWANTVGEEGWKQFYAHLGKARDRLAKAHALYPEFPEAATAMIAVAMGAGAHINEKARDWFDKAAAAQLDYFPAYHSYVWSIYPRWGGSHQKMFQFGVECMMTQRYDTLVPYRLMVILDNINDDRDNDFGVYGIPEVTVAVRQVLTNMSEKAPQQGKTDYYLSLLAAIAWRNADYREAAGVLDRLGPKADAAPFAQLRAWPPLAISQIRAMTSPQARAITAAEETLDAGDHNAAALSYLDVAKKLPKDHPGQFFVRYRVRTIEIQRDFDAGKVIELKPDADFLPWEVISGDWKLDKDGAFVATANATGQALLTCRVDFGPDYELQAKVSGPDRNNFPTAMLCAERWAPNRWSGAALDFQRSTVWALGTGTGQQVNISPDTTECTVVIKVSGGRFTVSVDGKVVAADRPLDPDTPENDSLVAIGINGQAPGRIARFRDVQIRRIEPKPQ